MIGVIELIEQNLQAMLDSGEIGCPTADCASRQFSVSVRNETESGFVGDAVCHGCDRRIELDLDDGPVERAEATLEALQAHDVPDPAPSDARAGGETAD